MKRIVVFETDGEERVLDAVPSYEDMAKIIGGEPEHVMVLDHIKHGRFVFTSMYVHEEGLALRLRRNAKATEVYQRNARAQYPESTNPFAAIRERFGAALPKGVTYHDGTPKWAIDEGYHDGPWVAGPAIFFEGWTLAEVEAAVGAAGGAL